MNLAPQSQKKFEDRKHVNRHPRTRERSDACSGIQRQSRRRRNIEAFDARAALSAEDDVAATNSNPLPLDLFLQRVARGLATLDVGVHLQKLIVGLERRLLLADQRQDLRGRIEGAKMIRLER